MQPHPRGHHRVLHDGPTTRSTPAQRAVSPRADDRRKAERGPQAGPPPAAFAASRRRTDTLALTHPCRTVGWPGNCPRTGSSRQPTHRGVEPLARRGSGTQRRRWTQVGCSATPLGRLGRACSDSVRLSSGNGSRQRGMPKTFAACPPRPATADNSRKTTGTGVRTATSANATAWTASWYNPIGPAPPARRNVLGLRGLRRRSGSAVRVAFHPVGRAVNGPDRRDPDLAAESDLGPRNSGAGLMPGKEALDRRFASTRDRRSHWSRS